MAADLSRPWLNPTRRAMTPRSDGQNARLYSSSSATATARASSLSITGIHRGFAGQLISARGPRRDRTRARLRRCGVANQGSTRTLPPRPVARRIACTRCFRLERWRTRCRRQRSRSRSARTRGSGSQTAGTRSRRANSASTSSGDVRASSRSCETAAVQGQSCALAQLDVLALEDRARHTGGRRPTIFQDCRKRSSPALK